MSNFKKETGIDVKCDYGGAGVLISRIRLTKRGDLFLPGEIFYIEELEKEGLISLKKNVCYFVPVILVRKGNPKKIFTLEDLVRPDLRLGLGDPNICPVGEISMKIFRKNKINIESVKKNLKYSAATVNELGLQIKTAHLDAVIVWDAVAAFYKDTGDIIPIPEEKNVISTVAIGLLTCSKSPELARRFIDYLISDKGKTIFKKHHYTVTLEK